MILKLTTAIYVLDVFLNAPTGRRSKQHYLTHRKIIYIYKIYLNKFSLAVSCCKSYNLFFNRAIHLSTTRCVLFGLYSRWTCGVVRGPCVGCDGRRTDDEQMALLQRCNRVTSGGSVEVQQARRPHKSLALVAITHAPSIHAQNPLSWWQKWESSHLILTDAGQVVRRMVGSERRKKTKEAERKVHPQWRRCLRAKLSLADI